MPRPLQLVMLDERRRALGGAYLELLSGASSANHRRDCTLMELVLLLGRLATRLELHPAVLVHALFLVESAVRCGAVLAPHTIRPLLLSAMVLASKVFYDEEMRTEDFRRAAAHLELRELHLMEIELLLLLDGRLVMWDAEQWQLYFDGLLHLMDHYERDIERFCARYRDPINALLGQQLLSAPRAAAPAGP